MYYFIDKLREVRRLQEKVAELEPTDERQLLLALSEAVTALAEGMALIVTQSGDSYQDGFWADVDGDSEHRGYSCPNCNSAIQIEESMIEDEGYIVCPKCGGPILIATNES